MVKILGSSGLKENKDYISQFRSEVLQKAAIGILPQLGATAE